MSTETPEFTVEWNDKTQDFLLSVGIPVTKLSDEIIEKITMCKGEYIPHKKKFLIPHAKLCILLDECFDYFSEESLVHIAKLLDKSNSDANGIRLKEHTEEKIREKSVRKSKQAFSKKIEAPKTTKSAIELFNDKIKETTFANPLVEESPDKEDRHHGKKEDKYREMREDKFREKREEDKQERREDKFREKREEDKQERREDKFREKKEEDKPVRREDKFREKKEERYRERRERKHREKKEDLVNVDSRDTLSKQVLLDYVSNLRHRMEKIEKYIKKM